MCLPPACFETRFGFVSGFDKGSHGTVVGTSVVKEFSKKKKIDEVRGGNIYEVDIVTTG